MTWDGLHHWFARPGEALVIIFGEGVYQGGGNANKPPGDRGVKTKGGATGWFDSKPASGWLSAAPKIRLARRHGTGRSKQERQKSLTPGHLAFGYLLAFCRCVIYWL
jgi:hypothetical protein